MWSKVESLRWGLERKRPCLCGLGIVVQRAGERKNTPCTMSSLIAHVVGTRIKSTEWTERRCLCGQWDNLVDQEFWKIGWWFRVMIQEETSEQRWFQYSNQSIRWRCSHMFRLGLESPFWVAISKKNIRFQHKHPTRGMREKVKKAQM